MISVFLRQHFNLQCCTCFRNQAGIYHWSVERWVQGWCHFSFVLGWCSLHNALNQLITQTKLAAAPQSKILLSFEAIERPEPPIYSSPKNKDKSEQIHVLSWSKSSLHFEFSNWSSGLEMVRCCTGFWAPSSLSTDRGSAPLRLPYLICIYASGALMTVCFLPPST